MSRTRAKWAKAAVTVAVLIPGAISAQWQQIDGAIAFALGALCLAILVLAMNGINGRTAAKPRRNSPYAAFRPSFDGRRRYTVIDGTKYWLDECTCTEFRVLAREDGTFEIALFVFCPRSEREAFSFVHKVVADIDLTLLLATCRRSSSDPEDADTGTATFDCLFDNGDTLRGIVTSADRNNDCKAYMF